jgi:hypothetical protein
MMARSAPSPRRRLSFSGLPAVTITRAPRWRATCKDPTLPEPPLMNSISPGLRPAWRISPRARGQRRMHHRHGFLLIHPVWQQMKQVFVHIDEFGKGALLVVAPHVSGRA